MYEISKSFYSLQALVAFVRKRDKRVQAYKVCILLSFILCTHYVSPNILTATVIFIYV